MHRLFLFILLAQIACQSPQKEVPQAKESVTTVTTDTVHFVDSTTVSKSDDRALDIMLAEDIRFNGQLKRFFTMSDFEKVFGTPDSVKLLQDEAPCITIFDTEAPDDKYLYKDGSRFETHQQQVAVDEFWFTNDNYISYKGIRIDGNTTVNAIKTLFPDAVMGKINEYREGELQLMILKEDKDGISDGHIKLFFKDDKVYFMHWWFPC